MNSPLNLKKLQLNSSDLSFLKFSTDNMNTNNNNKNNN